MKCLGKKCKFSKEGNRDEPRHCGLIDLINNIFEVINLPSVKNVYIDSIDSKICIFDSFDICRIHNLDWDFED